MTKEKVNYQKVYDLYLLCSEAKELLEFCMDYGVYYDKFMNWQWCQLWNEKLGKTIQREFEIKLGNRQLSVIDEIYVNGGLLFKKQYVAIAERSWLQSY